jgi:hypothetical protein
LSRHGSARPVVPFRPPRLVRGDASFRYPVVAANDRSRSLAEALGGIVVGTAILRKPGGVTLPEVVYRIPVPSTVSDQ